MATIEFLKVHGTGNDFIIYADPEGLNELKPEQIAKLCDRHFGIGADGLIRAVKTANIAAGAAYLAEYPEATWFMDYYNGDGSTAEMCGNGVRAYVHFLLQQSLLTVQDRREMVAIATRAGVKDVLIGAGGYSVDLGRWASLAPCKVKPAGFQHALNTSGFSLGNPHQVAQLKSLEELAELDLQSLPVLEPLPVNGSNIEFVAAQDPLVNDGVGQIAMRVYERGVGETLSCGTGAVAAALAARKLGGENMPNNWRVQVPGGVLGVRMFPTEDGEHVSLSGPAEIVFSGTIEV